MLKKFLIFSLNNISELFVETVDINFEVKGLNSEINLEFVPTKNGEQTLRLNGYFVHSKYNPTREAKQLVEKNYIPHHVHILFGYGCGYVVEEFLKRRAFQEKMIVIDPLFVSDSITIKHHGDDVYFYDHSVIPKLELITNTIAKEVRVSFKTFCTPNYDKVFPEIYKTLLKKVREIQYKNRTNDYTIIRYAKDWQRNFIENLVNLVTDYNIRTLNKKYSCPVVIASGGPSLTKQIPLVKEYRKSILLIAAGSTINSLLAHEIEPDYVVTIDGGEPNYHHFKDLKIDNAQIIYSMQNHYKIRESFTKNGYIVGSQGFPKLQHYLQEQLKIDLPDLDYGGSVAHSAFNVAQYISTGPIALIGQDLAYTDNLTHAASNKHARKIDEDFIREMEAFQVEGYYGDLVWTTPPLNSMRLDFEALLMAYPPTVPVFNCTEGGAKIHGFEQIPFKQFLERYANKEIVIHHETGNNELSNIEITNTLQKILKTSEELKKILSDGLKTMEKNPSSISFTPKVLNKLDRIEKKVNQLIDQLPIEPMTSMITIDIIQNYLPKENETAEETYKRVTKQTKRLYTQLIEAVDYMNECVHGVLKKLNVSEDIE